MTVSENYDWIIGRPPPNPVVVYGSCWHCCGMKINLHFERKQTQKLHSSSYGLAEPTMSDMVMWVCKTGKGEL